LFPGRNPVGRTLSLEGYPFLVVGVAQSVGSIFGQSEDNFVYIPLTTAQRLFGQRRSLGFQIKVSDAAHMVAAQDQARLVLRARHHLRYSEKDDFGIISPAAVLELWQELTGTIARVAVVVTVVFLLVGGLVIMNIMLATVSERTWEVGMRKTVGARKSDVLWQFLVESACLATLGGLLGVFVAFALTQLASRLTPVPAELSWTTAATALAVSSLVGLFFGVYPASRAAQLDPIAALRSEGG